MTELISDKIEHEEMKDMGTNDSAGVIPSRWEILTRNADIPWECIIPATWENDNAVELRNLKVIAR
jgi:hypothetical protein